jgi:hypothetical protein
VPPKRRVGSGGEGARLRPRGGERRRRVPRAGSVESVAPVEPAVAVALVPLVAGGCVVAGGPDVVDVV